MTLVTAATAMQGSYGRLGLGNSETQSSLRIVNTFPDQTCICKIACSRGGEGHCLAIDTNGAVYSWGDGRLIVSTWCECLCLYYLTNCAQNVSNLKSSWFEVFIFKTGAYFSNDVRSFLYQVQLIVTVK